MQVDYFFADSKAEAIAGVFVHPVQALEGFKDFVLVFFSYAHAVIAHAEKELAFKFIEADINYELFALFAKLKCVIQQLQQQFFNQVTVGIYIG